MQAMLLSAACGSGVILLFVCACVCLCCVAVLCYRKHTRQAACTLQCVLHCTTARPRRVCSPWCPSTGPCVHTHTLRTCLGARLCTHSTHTDSKWFHIYTFIEHRITPL